MHGHRTAGKGTLHEHVEGLPGLRLGSCDEDTASQSRQLGGRAVMSDPNHDEGLRR